MLDTSLLPETLNLGWRKTKMFGALSFWPFLFMATSVRWYAFFLHLIRLLSGWVLIGCSSLSAFLCISISLHYCTLFIPVFSRATYLSLSVCCSLFLLMQSSTVCGRSWHGCHVSIWRCAVDGIEHMWATLTGGGLWRSHHVISGTENTSAAEQRSRRRIRTDIIRLRKGTEERNKEQEMMLCPFCVYCACLYPCALGPGCLGLSTDVSRSWQIGKVHSNASVRCLFWIARATLTNWLCLNVCVTRSINLLLTRKHNAFTANVGYDSCCFHSVHTPASKMRRKTPSALFPHNPSQCTDLFWLFLSKLGQWNHFVKPLLFFFSLWVCESYQSLTLFISVHIVLRKKATLNYSH